MFGKELENIIKDAHLSWYGKKKTWKDAVWKVLVERYLVESLRFRLYPVAPPGEQKELEKPPEPKPQQKSSSSSMQECVNEGEEEIDMSLAFPKSDPVEEAPVSASADSATPAAPKEPTKEELELAMIRWVEMVECVVMLESIDWLHELEDTEDNKTTLDIIFRHGMQYCTKFTDQCLQPWNLSDWPLNPRAWLCEMERTLKTLNRKNWLPYWLRYPQDRNIRDDASASADGSVDPGNYILDMIVHALRLWQYTESSRVPKVMKQSIAEYGEKSNKSAHGPVNLRGNIVEAMQRNLQQNGSKLFRSQTEYDAFKYWYEWDSSAEPKWQSTQRASRGWGSGGQSSGGSSGWRGSKW